MSQNNPFTINQVKPKLYKFIILIFFSFFLFQLDVKAATYCNTLTNNGSVTIGELNSFCFQGHYPIQPTNSSGAASNNVSFINNGAITLQYINTFGFNSNFLNVKMINNGTINTSDLNQDGY